MYEKDNNCNPLNNAKLKPARLSVLVADNSSVGKGPKTSNAENLRETIKTLAAGREAANFFLSTG